MRGRCRGRVSPWPSWRRRSCRSWRPSRRPTWGSSRPRRRRTRRRARRAPFAGRSRGSRSRRPRATAGEPIHPPGDLAPGVAGEPPRHGLAGVRVEGADGGRPQVDVHPERGRILWHGSLPASLRRGCAYGTSTSLSQPRPAVTSGGSCLFSALGLGHSVCRCQNIGVAGVVVGDVLK